MGVGLGVRCVVPPRHPRGAMTVADSGRPPFDVVAIGSSAGGLEALHTATGTLLPHLAAPGLHLPPLPPPHPKVPAPLPGRHFPPNVPHAAHHDEIVRRRVD